jgi:hypothetical protein
MSLKTNPFDNMPAENIRDIMSWSSVQTMGRLEIVCKRFRQIASEWGWKMIFKRDYVGDLPYSESVLSAKRQIALLTTLKTNIKLGYYLRTETFEDKDWDSNDFIGRTIEGKVYRSTLHVLKNSEEISGATCSVYDSREHKFTKLSLNNNWNEIHVMMPLGDHVFALSDKYNKNLYLMDMQTQQVHVFQDVKMLKQYDDACIINQNIPNCSLLKDGSFVYLDINNSITITDYKTKKILFQYIDELEKKLLLCQQLDEHTVYLSFRKLFDPYGSYGLILEKEKKTNQWKIVHEFDLLKTCLHILPSKEFILIEDSKTVIKLNLDSKNEFTLPFEAGNILSNLALLKAGHLVCIVESGLCLIDPKKLDPSSAETDVIKVIPWKDFGENESVMMGFKISRKTSKRHNNDEKYELSVFKDGKSLFVFNHFKFDSESDSDDENDPQIDNNTEDQCTFAFIDIESKKCFPLPMGKRNFFFGAYDSQFPGKCFKLNDDLKLNQEGYDFLPSKEDVMNSHKTPLPWLNHNEFDEDTLDDEFDTKLQWFSDRIPEIKEILDKVNKPSLLYEYLKNKFSKEQDIFEQLLLESQFSKVNMGFDYYPQGHANLPVKFFELYSNKLEEILAPYSNNPFEGFGKHALNFSAEILKAGIKGITLKDAIEKAHEPTFEKIADLMHTELALPSPQSEERKLERDAFIITKNIVTNEENFILDYLNFIGVKDIMVHMGLKLSQLIHVGLVTTKDLEKLGINSSILKAFFKLKYQLSKICKTLKETKNSEEIEEMRKKMGTCFEATISEVKNKISFLRFPGTIKIETFEIHFENVQKIFVKLHKDPTLENFTEFLKTCNEIITLESERQIEVIKIYVQKFEKIWDEHRKTKKANNNMCLSQTDIDPDLLLSQESSSEKPPKKAKIEDDDHA